MQCILDETDLPIGARTACAVLSAAELPLDRVRRPECEGGDCQGGIAGRYAWGNTVLPTMNRLG